LALTAIHVEPGRTRLRHGLLRAQSVAAPPGWCRIGLLATTALLLGGDRVELEVSVGPGARLDLFDVAGTVAYNGRGRPAAWHTRIEVAPGAALLWSGEPFIVADGADVDRTLHLEIADGATVGVRETLVLGRSGQLGGRLRNRTRVDLGGRPVLIEDQMLDPATTRRLPGLLGDHRVIDSWMSLGAARDDAPSGATTYRLPGDIGWVDRFLGHDLADSPIGARWGRSRTSSLVSDDGDVQPLVG
jgi:urease accessory protein